MLKDLFMKKQNYNISFVFSRRENDTRIVSLVFMFFIILFCGESIERINQFVISSKLHYMVLQQITNIKEK